MELDTSMEEMEIPIHALNGSHEIYNSKKPLHIVVDTGSYHNFIHPQLLWDALPAP